MSGLLYHRLTGELTMPIAVEGDKVAVVAQTHNHEYILWSSRRGRGGPVIFELPHAAMTKDISVESCLTQVYRYALGLHHRPSGPFKPFLEIAAPDGWLEYDSIKILVWRVRLESSHLIDMAPWGTDQLVALTLDAWQQWKDVVVPELDMAVLRLFHEREL